MPSSNEMQRGIMKRELEAVQLEIANLPPFPPLFPPLLGRKLHSNDNLQIKFENPNDKL